MLTLIGLTLLFAAMTAALGIRQAVVRNHALRVSGLSPLPLVLQAGMTIWFLGAGLWALCAAR